MMGVILGARELPSAEMEQTVCVCMCVCVVDVK